MLTNFGFHCESINPSRRQSTCVVSVVPIDGWTLGDTFQLIDTIANITLPHGHMTIFDDCH